MAGPPNAPRPKRSCSLSSDQRAGLVGTWRITGMDGWDIEDVELLGPASIEFGRDKTGSFRFIAVEGWLDCRFDSTDGQPIVEFTFDGYDEGDRVSGRGWARLAEDGSLYGHIYIHVGEDSGFRAIRA